jgi:phenylpropionate dioxygenase-like ring-hydroxylating dioxygenase large terminal subunit
MEQIDPTALAQVRGPIEAARGLPNAFYTDARVLEEEKRRVFFSSWSSIGFAKDVPQTGDAKPVDFLGVPLFLLRGKDGSVRVFQNVCRHRGMRLVQRETRYKASIPCPYHAWCYGLDGALRSTPHVGGQNCHHHPDVARENLGLFEVPAAVWMDVVFVNLDGTAPPFGAANEQLIARWAEFDGQPLFHAGDDSSVSLELRTNWKLAVENYCESYHLPWVHPGLNSYSKLEDHYHIVGSGAFAGQGTRVYSPQIGGDNRRFADFAGLSDKWDSGAEYVALFPNTLLGVHRDHVFAIHLEPRGVDRTAERIEIYYADAAMAEPEAAELRQANTEMWKQVFVEDVGVVEGMQQGRSAPAFDGGKFSPVMDVPTHAFHAWVAGRFQDGPSLAVKSA